MRVAWGETELTRLGGLPEPGTPLVYDALLQPGDYLITLDADTPGPGYYRLTLNRADPFGLPADTEPNNAAPEASPIRQPEIEGTAAQTASGQDDDWYVVPAEDTTRTLSIDLETVPTSTSRVDALALRTDHAPETALSLTPHEDGSLGGMVEVPAGQPLAVGISGEGAYRLTVSDEDAPAYVAPGELPVKSRSRFRDTRRCLLVRCPADRGHGDADQHRQRTIDHRARCRPLGLPLGGRLQTDQVTLAAGESKTIPATITVGPDAWADLPVRITVRAGRCGRPVATGYVEGRRIARLRPSTHNPAGP